MIGLILSTPRTIDQYNEDLRSLLDLISVVANEHDRTTRDALIDLSVLQAGREEEL